MVDHVSPSAARPPGLAGRAARAVVSPWGRLVLLGLVVAGVAGVVLGTGVGDVLDRRSGDEAPGVGVGLLCVGVYAVGTFALLPKPALSAGAGALFGAGFGLLVAVVGTTVGALLGFAAGRLLGSDALRPVALRWGRLRTLDRRLSDRAFGSVLMLRLVPVLPFAAVNLAAALSRMRWPPFALATCVGTLPGNAAWVLAGASASSPTSWGLWLPAAAGVALLGAARLWPWARRGGTAGAPASAEGFRRALHRPPEEGSVVRQRAVSRPGRRGGGPPRRSWRGWRSARRGG
ncbi:VTT domain-containing protein [Streptomyces sp. B6B3]|uniref:TVP38/TMEM64 family protein n=1 Tax=Streptomyces sp. B6B3 TaxID=3153570 RepID=UPI00325E2AB0